METLLDHLSANRKSGELPQKLRMLVQKFVDVFAVSDHKLTQTDLVQHDIDTGNTKPIKQNVRPVPREVQPEFKATLSDLEARGVIAKSNGAKEGQNIETASNTEFSTNILYKIHIRCRRSTLYCRA
ncbi:hypothetical protein V3C99_018320 [Haemonchus contortus]|uniref:Integrase n=1 Tax=Haemonchus contortus TaxID=6289 RepID=A0A7I4Z4E4_HAECO